MAVTADRAEHGPDGVDGGHDPEVAVPARRHLRLRVARADRQGRAAGDARPRGDGGERAAHPARPPAAVARRLRRRPLPAQHAGRDADRRAAGRAALASLEATAQVGEEPWRIPIGMRESDLGVAELVLYESEHAIVAGPARSGQEPDAVDDRRGARGHRRARRRDRRAAARRCTTARRSTASRAPAATRPRCSPCCARSTGPVVVLIDDADGIDDVDGAVAGLLGAAGRTCTSSPPPAPTRCARSTATGPRRSASRRSACCCGPNIDYDGDLVGANLPRRAPVQMSVGRGYLAHNGELEIVQVASRRLSTAAKSGTRPDCAPRSALVVFRTTARRGRVRRGAARFAPRRRRSQRSQSVFASAGRVRAVAAVCPRRTRGRGRRAAVVAGAAVQRRMPAATRCRQPASAGAAAAFERARGRDGALAHRFDQVVAEREPRRGGARQDVPGAGGVDDVGRRRLEDLAAVEMDAAGARWSPRRRGRRARGRPPPRRRDRSCRAALACRPGTTGVTSRACGADAPAARARAPRRS